MSDFKSAVARIPAPPECFGWCLSCVPGGVENGNSCVMEFDEEGKISRIYGSFTLDMLKNGNWSCCPF